MSATDWKRWVRERLDLADLTDERATSVVEEIALLLEEHFAELLCRGLSATEADAATRDHIDDWEALRVAARCGRRAQRKTRSQRLTERFEERALGRGRAWAVMSDLLHDVHFALRTLRLNPMSSLVVILTLGL